jgi:hypothetical protein
LGFVIASPNASDLSAEALAKVEGVAILVSDKIASPYALLAMTGKKLFDFTQKYALIKVGEGLKVGQFRQFIMKKYEKNKKPA